uniref:MRE11 homolog, double strand break repair nuclease n=1 Tax=Macaca fascicularis TaxID=9541 RepID=I7GJG2_MACFA|nr:unnamed protein product [Macaca fascicularis]
MLNGNVWVILASQRSLLYDCEWTIVEVLNLSVFFALARNLWIG